LHRQRYFWRRCRTLAGDPPGNERRDPDNHQSACYRLAKRLDSCLHHDPSFREISLHYEAALRETGKAGKAGKARCYAL